MLCVHFSRALFFVFFFTIHCPESPDGFALLLLFFFFQQFIRMHHLHHNFYPLFTKICFAPSFQFSVFVFGICCGSEGMKNEHSTGVARKMFQFLFWHWEKSGIFFLFFVFGKWKNKCKRWNMQMNESTDVDNEARMKQRKKLSRRSLQITSYTCFMVRICSWIARRRFFSFYFSYCLYHNRPNNIII